MRLREKDACFGGFAENRLKEGMRELREDEIRGAMLRSLDMVLFVVE